MAYWSETLGVGPWYYNPRVPIVNYEYDGQHYEPHNSVALANSGFVQVELIQTRNDVPSMYRDFLRAGREGLQHVSSWEEDLDAVVARAEHAGRTVAQSGAIVGGIFIVQPRQPLRTRAVRSAEDRIAS